MIVWCYNTPNQRPSVILPLPVESLQSYLVNPGALVDVERRCPACETRILSRHGTYVRRVHGQDGGEQIILYRLRCRPCRLTVTLLPDVLAPYGRYPLALVQAAADAVLAGASCRAAAVATSGAELPAGVSATDALTWIRTAPSYQRIHAWLDRIAATAAADVAAAAEWLVRRVPGGIGAHLVTAPLDPAPCRSPRAEKRAALVATRLLARLFCSAADLDPGGQGWLRAWRRFEAVVLQRAPWRRPPRPPPEPQSS